MYYILAGCLGTHLFSLFSRWFGVNKHGDHIARAAPPRCLSRFGMFPDDLKLFTVTAPHLVPTVCPSGRYDKATRYDAADADDATHDVARHDPH